MLQESRAGAAPLAGERSDRLFLLLVFVALLLASWIRPLTVPDEGRYADVARWMVTSGDWLIPRLDGLPFFHKPPLLYWIDASLFSVFGISPQVARIAPVLAATITCLGVFWFLRRRVGSGPARLAVTVLATSTLFFGGSQYVNHDMMVATWITIATLAFADAAITGERRSVFLGYLAGGLGFMSKGLIGIALPGLVLLPWLIASGRWRRIPFLLNPFGILLLVAITLPWPLLVERQFSGFVHYFFIEQQFDRFSGGVFNNRQPWWFYVACMLVSYLPWLLVLPGRQAWQRARTLLGGEVAGLMLWWTIAIIGFFSIPVSKLAGYVLPAAAPIAVLLAAALYQYQPGHVRRLTVPLFLVVLTGILLAAAQKGLGELGATEILRLSLVAGGMVIAGAVLAVLVAREKIDWLKGAMLAAGLWCLTVACTVAIADHKNSSHDLAIKQYLTPGTELVFYRHYYYDIPFLLNLTTATPVVEDWPKVISDSWGLELKDGTRFDTKAGEKLWSEEQLGAAAKSGQRLLVLTPTSFGVPPSLPTTAIPVYTGNSFKAYLINP
jgi:4-amino-4-deoxy-L-arabinose transferase-like glycosyltransferase